MEVIDWVGVRIYLGDVMGASLRLPLLKSQIVPSVPISTSPISTDFVVTTDTLGRVTGSQQLTGAATYPFSYGYNQAGLLTSITYPISNRQISYSFDDANRYLSATGQFGGNPAPYVQSIAYTPHGATTSATFGGALLEQTTFNSRLQPTQIQAGNLLTLGYTFSPTQNNGNLLGQTINDGTTVRTQTYGYDPVNRLTSAGEDTTWTQTYSYDQFGNRALVSGSTDPSTATDKVLLITTSPSTPVTFTNNRWIASGVTYDLSGDLTNVQLDANDSYQAAFDAEGRKTSITTVVGGTPMTVNYAYDGEGKRITKAITQGSATTFVYDAQGQLTQEYGTTTDVGTQYLTADHLGSTRLATPISNGVVGTPARSDYLPFGQEIPSTWNRPNYQLDTAQRIKFTSKERDAETGLDWFGFRYMSSAQGRFTNPDEPFAGWDQHDPQSFNLYSYVQNNPLRYTDPNGRDVQVCLNDENGNQTCHTYNDAQYQSIYQAQNGKQGINLPGNFPAPTGDITCGGTVCGSATYVPGKGDAQDLTVSFALADLGGRAIGAALKGAWSGIVGLFGRGAEQSTVVIGKMADLNKGLGPGERELDLPNLSDPKLNWAQNSSRLREVMAEGNPIRDASAEPLVGGRPGSNTGFLRAERNLLENHGWTYSGGYWNPPSK
jgi:RHS repeat-associated protein